MEEKKRFYDFRFKVGEILKDERRDLEIIESFRLKKNGVTRKWYKYKCNKCSYIGDAVEDSLYKGNSGCASCSGKVVTPMNNIWNNQRWMCDLGLSEEDAKNNRFGTHNKGNVTCPHCGTKRAVRISHIYTYRSIFCKCRDKIPYSEKFMMEVLRQVGIEFEVQLSKVNFDWCQDKRYDFYIPKYNMIIETHGIQHYEESTEFTMTLVEVQTNDKYKQELAIKNNIDKYIVIDCRYSEMEWIRDNILNSELNSLFDLSKVDWFKCEEFALSNLVKEVCEYWNNNEDCTVTDMTKIFGLSGTTIRKYLVKGTKLRWCYYDPKSEKEKSRQKAVETNRKALSKEVAVIKDDEEIIRFSSLRELNDFSLERLGIKLVSSQVCIRLNPEHKKYGELYKGYTFKYV